MKVIELLNKINNYEEVPKKIKFDNTIFEYSKNQKEYSHKKDDGYYETLLYRVMNTHFIDILLRAEVEVIEEKKELEEKLDWKEIIDSVGKPIWDNKRKKWRVLDYYSKEKNKLYVSFSDTSYTENFGQEELYFKEIKESEEK